MQWKLKVTKRPFYRNLWTFVNQAGNNSPKLTWQAGKVNPILSGQIIIFHQPRFSWNKGIPPSSATFWGENSSCEVAIIWPEFYVDLCVFTSPKLPAQLRQNSLFLLNRAADGDMLVFFRNTSRKGSITNRFSSHVIVHAISWDKWMVKGQA